MIRCWGKVHYFKMYNDIRKYWKSPQHIFSLNPEPLIPTLIPCLYHWKPLIVVGTYTHTILDWYACQMNSFGAWKRILNNELTTHMFHNTNNNSTPNEYEFWHIWIVESIKNLIILLQVNNFSITQCIMQKFMVLSSKILNVSMFGP